MKKTNEISKLAFTHATFNKMPWLSKYFNQSEINKVAFRPFEYELITLDCGFSPLEKDGGGMLIEPYTIPARLGKKIMFFSQEGELVGQVGVNTKTIPTRTVTSRPYWFFGPSYKTIVPEHEEIELFSETVGEALTRLDQGHTVYYIISLLDCDLIITKPSFGDSIERSLWNEKKRAEVAVESAITTK